MTAESTFSAGEISPRSPQEFMSAEFYKRQLEVVCNNASLALFIMDEQQQCIYMNPAAESLTGYALAETYGRALHEVIHHTRPDGTPYPLCECPIDQAFPKNNREQGEEVFVHKQGYFYPVAYTASPIRDGDRVVGTIIEVRDITQEKQEEQAKQAATQREQALRHDAERARQEVESVLTSVSDGMYVLDFNWRYIYVNDRLCDMAGRSRADLLHTSIWEHFPAAIGTEVEVQFQRTMQERVQVQFEHQYMPWQRWFEHRVYPSEQGITVFVADITDRKRSEQMLLEQTRLLKMIATGASLEVCLAALCDSVSQLNPGTRACFLLTDAQCRSFPSSIAPDFPPTFGQGLKDAPITDLGIGTCGEAVYRGEPITCRDIAQDDRWSADWRSLCLAHGILACHSKPIFAVGGIPLGSLMLCFDTARTPTQWEHQLVEFGFQVASIVFERDRADTARRDSEQQYRNILESINDGFFALNENWQFTYLNQAARAMLDRALDELLGQNLWEQYPGLQGSDFERIYWAAMRDRVAGSSTSFYADHDCWYDVHAYPSADGITVYFRDVTTQIQATEALQQSEERYRTLFDSIDEGFCIIEILFDDQQTPIDYRFLETNLVFEQQTGLHNPVGNTAFQLIPNLESFWLETYAQVALTGEAVRFENGSDAMNRWFDVYACRLGHPEEYKVAIVFNDISDRKRIEREREHLLQWEQTAREAAETANRIKDEFLAVLSHELRSPLNPILGWSKLLLSGRLNPERQTEAIKTIERNANLQAQLIEDLLDISRILQGKLSLTATPVNLPTVIHAALDTVRLAAEAKAIALHFTTVPDSSSSLQVYGDAARLQQVMWNLLSNAVKFTPTGGRVDVVVSEDRSQESPTPPSVQITVRDTGKGIRQEFLPYVFEYFRQEDGSTTRKFGGLGLGLAIARQIVELHGGTVVVESAGEGQGATFRVRLPLWSEPREVDGDRDGQVHSSLVAGSMPLANLHILMIDDDQDTREFQAFLLEHYGAQVTAVASGMAALQQLDQFVPDLIISDVGMAEMDGYMLIQQLRSHPIYQHQVIPAIALTAYAHDLDQKKAIRAGFQHHLTKPIDPEKLIETITAVLSQNSLKN